MCIWWGKASEAVTEKEHARPRIRDLKVCNLRLSREEEENVYLVGADNNGRICIWNVHECLAKIVEINDEQTERETETEQTESEDEDEDVFVDENGLFVFA